MWVNGGHGHTHHMAPDFKKEKIMGMGINIIGFKPPDKKWLKMKAIWDLCKEAFIDPPEEVEEFFDYEDPDKAGVLINLKNTPAVEEWSADMKDGFQVDLKKLPEGIKFIRFFCDF